MLRQSNLAPGSVGKFDATRHTTRADVAIQPPGLVIRVKWSKTNADNGPNLIVLFSEIWRDPKILILLGLNLAFIF